MDAPYMVSYNLSSCPEHVSSLIQLTSFRLFFSTIPPTRGRWTQVFLNRRKRPPLRIILVDQVGTELQLLVLNVAAGALDVMA
jgi:hypothetical protein